MRLGISRRLERADGQYTSLKVLRTAAKPHVDRLTIAQNTVLTLSSRATTTDATQCAGQARDPARSELKRNAPDNASLTMALPGQMRLILVWHLDKWSRS